MIVSFLASSGDPENARLEKVRRVVVANNERANMIPSAKKNQPNYTMQLVQIAEKQCEPSPQSDFPRWEAFTKKISYAEQWIQQ